MSISAMKFAAALGLLSIGSGPALAQMQGTLPGGSAAIPATVTAPAYCTTLMQGIDTSVNPAKGTITPPPTPLPGIYRATVTVTQTSGYCNYTPGGKPVPDFIYYYPGPNKNTAAYYNGMLGGTEQVYMETGYTTAPPPTATQPCQPVQGTAQAWAFPPGGGSSIGINYWEYWAYVDANSFVIHGHYKGPTCEALESILLIRTGGEVSPPSPGK
jgi:hypothetical protein